MIRAICIGGSKDRQELTAVSGRELRVYCHREPVLMASAQWPPSVDIFASDALEVRFETYRYEELSYGDRLFPFWVHESLTVDQAFAKIILAYGAKAA